MGIIVDLIIILIIVIEVLAIATVSMIYALKFNKYKKQSGYDPIINEHIAQLKEEEAKRVKIIKKFYPKSKSKSRVGVMRAAFSA